MQMNIKAGCALSFFLSMAIMITVFVVAMGFNTAGLFAFLSF